MDTQSIVMIVTSGVALVAGAFLALLKRADTQRQAEIIALQERVQALQDNAATKADMREMEARLHGYVHDVEKRTDAGFNAIRDQLNQLIGLHLQAPRRGDDHPQTDYRQKRAP